MKYQRRCRKPDHGWYQRVTLVNNLTPDAYGAYRKLAPFYRT